MRSMVEGNGGWARASAPSPPLVIARSVSDEAIQNPGPSSPQTPAWIASLRSQ